jgi:hypothetical protein
MSKLDEYKEKIAFLTKLFLYLGAYVRKLPRLDDFIIQ